jgi:hypothetical protein
MKGFICSWSDQINEGEMAGAFGTYGGKRNAQKFLMGESEGGKLLGRPGRRWEGNIKMDPKKCVGRAWTRLICLRIWTIVRLL